MEERLVWKVLQYKKEKDEVTAVNVFDSLVFCRELLEFKKYIKKNYKLGAFYEIIYNGIEDITKKVFYNTINCDVIVRGDYSFKEFKVSIYEQLLLNMKPFVNYIIKKIKLPLIFNEEL